MSSQAMLVESHNKCPQILLTQKQTLKLKTKAVCLMNSQQEYRVD